MIQNLTDDESLYSGAMRHTVTEWMSVSEAVKDSPHAMPRTISPPSVALEVSTPTESTGQLPSGPAEAVRGANKAHRPVSSAMSGLRAISLPDERELAHPASSPDFHAVEIHAFGGEGSVVLQAAPPQSGPRRAADCSNTPTKEVEDRKFCCHARHRR